MFPKLILFLSVLAVACNPAGTRKQKPKKVLFVILDGISADVIEKLPTPHLDAVASAGGYTRAYVGGEKGGYSETPTISAVGYNSLHTGTWVNKHNVWGNDIKEPNYHYWTIFRLAAELAPRKKTAIFSTWLDNRTKLIGEGLPETGNLHLDYHFDGFELDTVSFPHDEHSLYIHRIDEHVTDESARYIREEGPDLSWVYLQYTDDMGHRHGDSEAFYQAVETADDQVGRIWEAVRERMESSGEDWQVFITTDHGRDAKTGMHHGGQSDRERLTWIVTNARELNPYFHDHQPGIVDIMPSMLRFMELEVPREQLWEIDGIPLTGKVSVAAPQATWEADGLHLSWKALEQDGNLKIWGCPTNYFRDGGQDRYELLAEVPLSAEQAVVDLKPPAFYKVVLEGKHNTVNRWVLAGE